LVDRGLKISDALYCLESSIGLKVDSATLPREECHESGAGNEGKRRKHEQNSETSPLRKIRYAVVGLGYISQVAVLPAIAHARENSELVGLVSGDGKKLDALSKKYRVPRTYSDEQYANCLSDGIDAVYIALANSLHRPYAESAARTGVHVLCEKPMAVTEPG
jgi:hypothetical protein